MNQKKKILIIGSSVADVLIDVERFPAPGEDLHILNQQLCIGGCAFNVSDIIRHFQVPHLLFSPAGTGIYGDFIRNEWEKRGIVSILPVPDLDNGCCYCFVDQSGERTFASYHGAEYLFEKEWFELIDASQYDTAYVCGLEIEEKTGEHIVSFLEQHTHISVYYAPGPRIDKQPKDLMRRLFALHPTVHLNKSEAILLSGETDPQHAAMAVSQMTGQDVIITLGKDGAYCLENGSGVFLPSRKAKQVDATGAGDAHIGAVMALKKLGFTLSDAAAKANLVSAAVVEKKGASLDHKTFLQCFTK
ncbi:PfkB family carbohydrate kinase [Anaerostipes sp.]|uniref:PfkB family carbohydrate kinase n=1 Tax=Anaerostipes sp. TaxID=1872530 RepID=UPI0025BA977B|nr:PfkB family carbohydrate kinase [Anaerostipes sp.]MBS7007496.1 carbohydrate kinase [Anaerostipes sp.]